MNFVTERSATVKQVLKVKMARSTAAGLALVAATALAAPGWGGEPVQGQKLELKQDKAQTTEKDLKQEQELKDRQKEGKEGQSRKEDRGQSRKEARGRERERTFDERGPAARAIRTIGHELRLSRDQRQSLRDLVRQHADELRGAAREVGEARRNLREKTIADTLDEAAIRSAAERLGSAIGTASVLTARLAGEIRPALTVEQRARLRKVSTRWESRRDKWRDRIERWD